LVFGAGRKVLVPTTVAVGTDCAMASTYLLAFQVGAKDPGGHGQDGHGREAGTGELVDSARTTPIVFRADFEWAGKATARAAITKREPRAVVDDLFIFAPPFGLPGR
jgi:hypothetical protein